MREFFDEWPTRYALRIFDLILLVLFWNWIRNKIPEIDLAIWIDVLKKNDSLSGWAQFLGAMISIAIAIGVPAWQHYRQRLTERRAAAEASHANALSIFYLLGEIKSYLERALNSASIPRHVFRDDIGRDDLLRRIHALEMRENDENRLTLLFHARGAVHTLNQTMSGPWSQNMNLGEGEVDFIKSRVQDSEVWIAKAAGHRDIAVMRRARLRQKLLGRFLYPLIAPIVFWYMAKKRIVSVSDGHRKGASTYD